jgi:hypothetical protein
MATGSHFMTIPLCEPAGSHKSGALNNRPYANADVSRRFYLSALWLVR